MAEKMKIAVWHNLPSGGGKRALYDHVRGLVERGHTVVSWCPASADQTYLPLGELIEEHVLPFTWERRGAKNRFGEIVDPYRDTVDMIAAMDEHCRQCAAEINRGGFDLLFANTCELLHVSPIGRYVATPKLLYLQEPCRYLYEATKQEPYRCLSAPDAAPQLPWLALPKNGTSGFMKSVRRFPRDFMQMQGWRLQAREEWLSAKAFDALLVNSFFSRESVLRAYGLESKVCYLGIDTGRFVNRHLARENFVVGLGAMLAHKNIKFVIDALAHVRAPRPRLVWIGNMNNRDYLREITEHAAALGVDFVPRMRVSDDELVDTLNRAMMMVYAPRLEPFGYAPLEANACGAPVVAVAEGGIRETITDGVNGLLVDGDPQAMAAAIERLISDPVYARQIGEEGARLVAQRWSMAAALDRLEGRFAELLNQARPAAPKKDTPQAVIHESTAPA